MEALRWRISRDQMDALISADGDRVKLVIELQENSEVVLAGEFWVQIVTDGMYLVMVDMSREFRALLLERPQELNTYSGSLIDFGTVSPASRQLVDAGIPTG